MFTLTFREPGSKPARHPVSDSLLVGREQGCDVVLQSKEVSRRHARFFVKDGVLHVEDLGSANGVFVQGAKVSAATPVQAGSDVEIGDVKVAVAGSAADGVGAGAVLRGKGREIRLPAKAVVGRGADCDVVLDDDSVSRRHAELSRDERGFYRVRDLDSANGTFVDGVRLKKDAVAVKDGAKLRFGDVELAVSRPAPRAPIPRQKLLLGALVAAIFVLTLLIVLRPARHEEQRASAGDDATALLEQAQAAIESERPDEAARLAQQAIDADPLSAPARKVLAQAKLEQDASRALKDAAQKAQLGREHDALQILTQVPQQSRFFARARIRAKELGQTILRVQTSPCRASNTPQEQIEACSRVLDVKCQTAAVEDDPLYKALRAAEKRVARKVAWTCPQELAPLFVDVSAAPEGAAVLDEKAFTPLYPEPAVRAAALQYARGDVAGAIRALGNKPGQLARETVERMKVVDGRFREGQTALLSNALDRADRAWGEALRADQALMPVGAESFFGRQMRTTLSRAHARAGDEKLAKFQYGSAYDEFVRGLAADPRDPYLLDQLARMEKVAEGLLNGSPSCDQLQVAAHITRADPPSPAHEAAMKGLAGCR